MRGTRYSPATLHGGRRDGVNAMNEGTTRAGMFGGSRPRRTRERGYTMAKYDASNPINVWVGNLGKYNEGELVGE